MYRWLWVSHPRAVRAPPPGQRENHPQGPPLSRNSTPQVPLLAPNRERFRPRRRRAGGWMCLARPPTGESPGGLCPRRCRGVRHCVRRPCTLPRARPASAGAALAPRLAFSRGRQFRPQLQGGCTWSCPARPPTHASSVGLLLTYGRRPRRWAVALGPPRRRLASAAGPTAGPALALRYTARFRPQSQEACA